MTLALKLISKIFKKSILRVDIDKNENRKVNIKGTGSLYDLMDSYPLILPTLFSEIKGYNYVIKRQLATKLLVKAMLNLESQNIYISPQEVLDEYKSQKQKEIEENS